MYLDNPKKLNKDLCNIAALDNLMKYLEEVGYAKDLYALIILSKSHVYPANNWLTSSWDPKYCKDNRDRLRLYNDKKKLFKIIRTINKELRSKYVMVCENCGNTSFFDADPNNDGIRHYCGKCRKNHFSISTLEDWSNKEKIDLDFIRKKSYYYDKDLKDYDKELKEEDNEVHEQFNFEEYTEKLQCDQIKYLGNPDKLYEDLVDIKTIRKNKNINFDLSEGSTIGELWSAIYEIDSFFNILFDIKDYESYKEECETLDDHDKFYKIYKTFMNEMRYPYIMECENCNTTYYCDHNPKNDDKLHFCKNCGKNCLSIYKIEDWIEKENLDIKIFRLNPNRRTNNLSKI